jgi:hypothetical protein
LFIGNITIINEPEPVDIRCLLGIVVVGSLRDVAKL